MDEAVLEWRGWRGSLFKGLPNRGRCVTLDTFRSADFAAGETLISEESCSYNPMEKHQEETVTSPASSVGG